MTLIREEQGVVGAAVGQKKKNCRCGWRNQIEF
jgi:hypothetical protein